MARIAGIDLPGEKRIEAALSYLYGVGRSLSSRILKEAGVSPDVRTKNLTEEQIAKIREVIEKRKIPVEGELRRMVAANIKRLKEIGSYRGLRHLKNLPVRGQRTRTNARTKRGRRQTIGGMKKEEKA
jgi:small subunit ribosomal protein S13